VAILYPLFCSSLVSGAIVLAAAMTTSAQQPPAQETAGARDPPPPLPPELLKDSKLIEQGMALWQEQCAHCHGAKAYPGKAPKLEPHRYTPEFVWDRVHNGFRGMPPWKDVYTPEQELAVVAYVMSEEFWP
jgi:mono/diheme cytochrome c family protein